MIIADVGISSLKAPLAHPFRTASGQHDRLDNILVRLTLDTGATGWGEAAIAPHITGETVSATQKNLRAIAALLPGRDVCTLSETIAALRRKYPHNMAAVAAVEMAWLDAACRNRGIPLWRWFAAAPPERLVSDVTLVIGSLRETRSAAGKFYRQGFRKFKIKIGRDWDLDFSRVMAVKTLAPRAQISLDANQGYTAEQTMEFLMKLKARRIHPVMIEQPVARDDIRGLCEIKRSGLAPVCADESARSAEDCRVLIREKAVDVINIKLMKSGFAESVKMVSLARRAGLKLMIGGMMESALAMTAAAHFAGALRCFDFIDLDTPYFIKGRWARSPYLNSKGVYNVKKAQRGIGLDVRV